MKKIAIWKIILLNAITFGLYSIYWFARNRAYLVKNNGEKIPKWPWLLAIPVVYGVGSIVGFTYLVAAIIAGGDIDASIRGYNISILVGCLAGIALFVWWLSYFSEAMEKVTQGRLKQWLSVVLGMVVGAFVIVFHQYYINRLDQNEKDQTYPTSSSFAIVASIFIVLGVFSLVSTVTSFSASTEAIKTELVKAKAQYSELTELNSEYTKCTASLATDFPGDLTDDNKAAYDAASKKCNDLFAEYESAMDKYLKGER